MKKTRKILFSAALLSSGLTMAQTTTAEKSPNVIYIMADDLGIVIWDAMVSVRLRHRILMG